MFAIEALPSLVLGFVVLMFLDNSVKSAKWLTDREQAVILAEVERDRERSSTLHLSFMAMLRDPKIWLLSGIYLCVALGIYIVSFWLPTIIAGTGVESLFAIGLLTAIPYSCAVVAMILNNIHADRTGERRLHAAIPCLVTAAGLVVTALGMGNTVVAMIGLSLAAAGASTTQAAFWTLPSAFLGGVAAAGGIALINSVGNISGLLSTSLVGWLSDLTGSTISSLYGIAVLLAVGAALLARLPAHVVDDPSRVARLEKEKAGAGKP